ADVAVSGAGSIPLTAPVLTATADVSVTGAGAWVLPLPSVTAGVDVAISGTAALVVPGLVLQAAGFAGGAITATGAWTLQPPVVSGTGIVQSAGPARRRVRVRVPGGIIVLRGDGRARLIPVLTRVTPDDDRQPLVP
ncbi:MAG: hypothetical protein RQ723_12355, partial [Desulfuromonadales bacterium]|nr:hypothetical protein [Desulfuromonadales bacterium]